MNNDHNTMFDQTMQYPGEAIALSRYRQQLQQQAHNLTLGNDVKVANAMDGDYVAPEPALLSRDQRIERMRQVIEDHKLGDNRLSQTETSAMLLENDVNIHDAEVDDHIINTAPKSRRARNRERRKDPHHLERVAAWKARKSSDDHTDRMTGVQSSGVKGLVKEAEDITKAARHERKKERRARMQAMNASTIGPSYQDTQQQQDESAPNAQSIDATKQTIALGAATEADNRPMSQAMDTDMDVEVPENMQQLSVMPALDTHNMHSDRDNLQQDMDGLKPGKANTTKKTKCDPRILLEHQAMTILSRVQNNVAKSVANGLSAEDAQREAVEDEYKRLDKIDSRRQKKSAKIEDPKQRRAKQGKNSHSRKHAEKALRMILEPGYLTPEEAAAFRQRVEEKVLKTNARHIKRAQDKLSGTREPGVHTSTTQHYSASIAVLQRNLENLKNTFGTQSDQYLNFRFMVEETIKELEAKLTLGSTVPQAGSRPTQMDFEQQQSYLLPQGEQALPLNHDDDDSSDDDDNDDYDNDDDNDNGGVGLNMSAGNVSGSSGYGTSTISTAQSRTEDENHLQALRALLSEISLQT